jgi:hypothetical protein
MVWKNTIQVFQTAGVPPYSGSTILRSLADEKQKEALINKVAEYQRIIEVIYLEKYNTSKEFGNNYFYSAETYHPSRLYFIKTPTSRSSGFKESSG